VEEIGRNPVRQMAGILALSCTHSTCFYQYLWLTDVKEKVVYLNK